MKIEKILKIVYSIFFLIAIGIFIVRAEECKFLTLGLIFIVLALIVSSIKADIIIKKLKEKCN